MRARGHKEGYQESPTYVSGGGLFSWATGEL